MEDAARIERAVIEDVHARLDRNVGPEIARKKRVAAACAAGAARGRKLESEAEAGERSILGPRSRTASPTRCACTASSIVLSSHVCPGLPMTRGSRARSRPSLLPGSEHEQEAFSQLTRVTWLVKFNRAGERLAEINYLIGQRPTAGVRQWVYRLDIGTELDADRIPARGRGRRERRFDVADLDLGWGAVGVDGLLAAWLAWARRCRRRPFVKLARTIA